MYVYFTLHTHLKLPNKNTTLETIISCTVGLLNKMVDSNVDPGVTYDLGAKSKK